MLESGWPLTPTPGYTKPHSVAVRSYALGCLMTSEYSNVFLAKMQAYFAERMFERIGIQTMSISVNYGRVSEFHVACGVPCVGHDIVYANRCLSFTGSVFVQVHNLLTYQVVWMMSFVKVHRLLHASGQHAAALRFAARPCV